MCIFKSKSLLENVSWNGEKIGHILHMPSCQISQSNGKKEKNVDQIIIPKALEARKSLNS